MQQKSNPYTHTCVRSFEQPVARIPWVSYYQIVKPSWIFLSKKWWRWQWWQSECQEVPRSSHITTKT